MSCGRKGIRIDKSTNLRIIVAALEVVQPRFLVVYIPAVAQGVLCAQCAGHGAGGGGDVAPGVVDVIDDRCAAAVQNANHVALNIGDIIVICTVIIDRHGLTVNAIGEDQDIAAYCHLDKRRAVVGITVGGATAAALCAHPVHIVGIRPGGAILFYSCKPPAIVPSVGMSTIA